MDFLQLTNKRYSTRSFSNKEVEQDKIDKLLEVAHNAPTAKNLQPQKILIIKSKEGLELAKKATPCTYNAPLVFLICIDKDVVWRHADMSDVTTTEIDAAIVTTQMSLMATELGLGSVIVRMFNNLETQKIFNLPDNIYPVLFLPVGYPSDIDKPSPKHNDKKPIEEMYKII